MRRLGYYNLFVSKFYCEIAKEAHENHKTLFGTKIDIPNTKSHQIAANLVFRYLKNNNLEISLKSIDSECNNTLFADSTNQVINDLKITSKRPPIQYLIKMRWIIPELSTNAGWFFIDSEISNTVTQSEEPSSGFQSDTRNRKCIVVKQMKKRTIRKKKTLLQ